MSEEETTAKEAKKIIQCHPQLSSHYLSSIYIPIPRRLFPYFMLFMGLLVIVFELLWIDYILAGNVPSERMGEYIGAMLLGLGITAFCFWYFWRSRKKKERKEVKEP